MANAPVCPISRSQPVAGQAARLLAPAVQATDLPSLITAVNQLANTVRQLIGTGIAPNNMGAATPVKQVGFVGYPEWDEEARVTDDVRVFHEDPNHQGDKSQWVDVTRIRSIRFRDRNSNDVFLWEYNRPDPGITGPGGSGGGITGGPLEEDFFQRVSDVQWGGLAVEFGFGAG